MSRTVVYPGSFDPVTYGHIDIIKRASKLFTRVIVAVVSNPNKKTLFSMDERLEMLYSTLKEFNNVEVDSFDGLLIDYVKFLGVSTVVRGLRAVSDFEYEFQMALVNRRMYPDFDTIFLMPSEKYIFLSSSIVKEIAKLGGDVSDFVPPIVKRMLQEKYK